jgi:hypothetical protein
LSQGVIGEGRRRSARSKAVTRRRWIAGGVGLLALTMTISLVVRGNHHVMKQDRRGTYAWSLRYYGNPDSPRYSLRNIVQINFLGRIMSVNKKASRHFLRLERIFQARAPEYAAAVATGTLDDWSYINRAVRGEKTKSNHAFGLAIDVNALTNPLGGTGDMPANVVAEWEREGGVWGGSWSRPDLMHFETHLTPAEIKHRYRPNGTPREWYLSQLLGG